MDLLPVVRILGIEKATKLLNEAIEQIKRENAPMTYADFINELSTKISEKFNVDIYEVDEYKYDINLFWNECGKATRAEQKAKIAEAIEEFENCLDHYGKNGLVSTLCEEDVESWFN